MNSIKSLNRYSEDYQTVLLNTFGEWNYFKNYNKDIKFLDLFLAKKFILRISGLPKLTFFRKFIWRNALKKIHCVTCPTLKTQEYILNQNLVSKNKIELLYDPVINVGEIQKKINEKFSVPILGNYYCAIGRLTKQKNFMFLCKAFKKVINKYPNIRLLIIGEGEQKKILTHYIKKNDLEKNIFLIGFF